MMSRHMTFVLMGSVILLYSGLTAFMFVQNDNYRKMKDEYEYMHIAKSLYAGSGIVYKGVPDVVLPPGFPILAGIGLVFSSNAEGIGQWTSLVAFSLSLLMLFQLSKHWFANLRDRAVVLSLFALHSNVMINAVSGKSESAFVLVLLSLVLLTVKFTNSWTQIIVFGAGWACLYLIRPEGLLIGAVLCTWLLLSDVTRGCRGRLVVGAVITCLLTLPYVYFLREQTGRWQLSGKTYANLVLGEASSPYQTSAPDEAGGRYSIIEKILQDPSSAKSVGEYLSEPESDFVTRLPGNASRLLNYYLSSLSLPGVLLLIIGVRSIPKSHRTLLAGIWSVSLVYLLFFILPRQQAIFQWIVAIPMTFGLVKAVDFGTAHWRWSESKSRLIFCTTAVLLGAWLSRGPIKQVLKHGGWIS